jgi:hypothetical protein
VSFDEPGVAGSSLEKFTPAARAGGFAYSRADL